jgi:hypothetical protein
MKTKDQIKQLESRITYLKCALEDEVILCRSLGKVNVHLRASVLEFLGGHNACGHCDCRTCDQARRALFDDGSPETGSRVAPASVTAGETAHPQCDCGPNQKTP